MPVSTPTAAISCDCLKPINSHPGGQRPWPHRAFSL